MPEMLTARVSNDEYAQVHAVACALDITISQLTRESVFGDLEEWRKKAQAAQFKRANLPHGVTELQTEQAAENLVIQINRTEAIRLDMSELFSPKSKALLRLLAFVWQEQPSGVSKKALDHLGERVKARIARVREDTIAEEGREGGTVDETPVPPRPLKSPPPGKKVRNYPRRGSKR